MYLDPARRRKRLVRRVLSIHAQMHSPRGEASQHIEPHLKALPVILNGKIEVGGQGGRVERRDEDVPRRNLRVGDHVERALAHQWPYAPLQHARHDVLTLERGGRLRPKLLILDVGIGACHHDAVEVSSLPTLHHLHHPAHRGAETDGLIPLVAEQRGARLHSIALVHQQARHHGGEIRWVERVVPLSPQALVDLLGSADQFDIEAPAYPYCLRHTIHALQLSAQR